MTSLNELFNITVVHVKADDKERKKEEKLSILNIEIAKLKRENIFSWKLAMMIRERNELIESINHNFICVGCKKNIRFCHSKSLTECMISQ